MTDQPDRNPPTLDTPKAPRPPHEGPKPSGPKLGREEPGRGLDTGVDTGAIQPGASGDNSALN